MSKGSKYWAKACGGMLEAQTSLTPMQVEATISLLEGYFLAAETEALEAAQRICREMGQGQPAGTAIALNHAAARMRQLLEDIPPLVPGQL